MPPNALRHSHGSTISEKPTHRQPNERTHRLFFFFSTTSATTPFVCILILIGFDSPNRADVIKFFSSRSHLSFSFGVSLVSSLLYLFCVTFGSCVVGERGREQKTHGCYLSLKGSRRFSDLSCDILKTRKSSAAIGINWQQSVFRLRCVCIV